MKERVNSLLHNNKGVNTVEIVIILAVIVGIALIFRDQMLDFVTNLLSRVTGSEVDFNPSTIRSSGSLK